MDQRGRIRSLTLVLASSVLAAACALTEPPPPAGTVMLQIQVRNVSDEPLGELGVKVRGGTLPNAAQPPWVAANSTTMVTFHVPISDEWWLAVNGIGIVVGERLQRNLRGGACLEFSSTTNADFSCG